MAKREKSGFNFNTSNLTERIVDMVLAGIEVVDTPLVHDAIELARSASEPYLSTTPCAHGFLVSWLLKGRDLLQIRSSWRCLGFARSGTDRPLLRTGTLRSRWGQCSARVFERTWHSGTSHPSRLGRHCAAHDSFHRSTQRTRGRPDAFRNRPRRDRRGSGSDSAR